MRYRQGACAKKGREEAQKGTLGGAVFELDDVTALIHLSVIFVQRRGWGWGSSCSQRGSDRSEQTEKER